MKEEKKTEAWEETFEDIWWGSFDSYGERNSHEYEKMLLTSRPRKKLPTRRDTKLPVMIVIMEWVLRKKEKKKSLA